MIKLYIVILLLYSLFSPAIGYAQQSEKPNLILIVADDLGYADISYTSNKNNVTPNLSALANEGMRLMNFHSNGPVCSPTRAALLTGRYQQRSGIEHALKPEDKGLPSSEITIAEYLKKQGYATAVYGKWHLGTAPGANPVHHGFDEFRGHLNSVDYHSHIGPWGNPDWWIDDQLKNEEGYNSDLIASHATRFIHEHKDDPFFIYIPFSNIHFPWCTPDDPEFWQKGINYYQSIETKLGPHSPQEDITLVVRRMIFELDKSVGRIVEAVRKQGLEKETLIFFASDNGGYVHYSGRHRGQISDNGPLRGQKGELYEGGIRVPAIAWWPGRIQRGSKSNVTALTMDLLPTFLELAGGTLPSSNGPNALDGQPLQPVLFENGTLPERDLFWRFREKAAVRRGSWKMVFSKNVASPPELFNLAEDIGEQHNLASVHPEIIKQLQEAFTVWEKDVDQ